MRSGSLPLAASPTILQKTSEESRMRINPFRLSRTRALLQRSVMLVGLAGGLLPSSVLAASPAPPQTLKTEKEKISYAFGLSVAHTFQPIAAFIDANDVARAVKSVLTHGQPLITLEQAKATDAALRANLAKKGDQRGAPAPASAPAAAPSKRDVSLMLGTFVVGPSLERFGNAIDLETMTQALSARLANRPVLMNDQQVADTMRAFIASQQDAAARSNRQEGERFLSHNKAQKGVQTTASGLQYQVLRPGSGKHPTATNTVRVNYEGKLLNGKVFDSSYQRAQPAEFRLDQVIAGWTEGVALMPVGAKYRFWIPAALAYGAKGAPGGVIGPDATLTFDIELLDILP